MEKLVSIIIPSYNAAKYLEQCIDSILNQTYSNLEIVIVNDGSTDETPTILKKYEKNESIKIINQNNGGVSLARNTGLTNVSGQYITFIDADDWIDRTHIENLVKNLEETNSDMSICLSKWQKRNTAPFKNKKNKILILTQQEALQEIFIGKLFPGGYLWNKLFKKSILTDLIFDSTIHYTEDLLFVYQYLKRCKKVVFSNLKTYHYIKTNGSIVRSKFNNKKLTALTNLENIKKDSLKSNPSLFPYIDGLYCEMNFEILFYLVRDKVKNPELKKQICEQFSKSKKSLTKTKKFHKYRRILIPFGFSILKLF